MSRSQPRARNAAATNRLLALTRREEFRNELLELFRQSKTLQRREGAMVLALQAHPRREYALSVPLLLAQMEGILRDCLFLNGIVAKKGKKLYALDVDGKIKLSRNGKPIEIHGLGQLVRHSGFESDASLQRAANLIVNQIVPARNGIMHGLREGTAKESVQSILLILMFAGTLFAIESATDRLKTSTRLLV